MTTTIHEIADGIHRISTPIPEQAIGIPGGFTFNQYLIVDDEPLLFHTGMRSLFPLVREAMARVLPPESLRWISFSHEEADECGSLNDWLAIAPRAEPLCAALGAQVSIGDRAVRPPRGLRDGETVALGKHTVRWIDAPHLPHNYDCGYLFETTTSTLLCGDLFTQPGADGKPLTDGDILTPSVMMLHAMPSMVAITPGARKILEGMAALSPKTLAVMHGSAWQGDGAGLLGRFADAIGAP